MPTAISEIQRQALEKELGKDIAEQVIAQADTVGKELESEDVAFRSVPDGFAIDTLILLSAFKTLNEKYTEKIEAQQQEISEYRKTTGDLANQVAQVIEHYESTGDKTLRLQENVQSLVDQVKSLLERRPAASKSPNTQIPDDDAQANFLIEKNNEGDKPLPILNQMQKMGP